MELWDVYNCHGNPTGEIKPKGTPWAEGERHLAMELWLVDGENRLLLQHRAENCEVFPSVWALTAGRAIAGEDSRQACLREAQEELGIALEPEEPQFLRRIIRVDYIWDIYLVQRPVWAEPFVLQAQEVEQVDWLTIEELRHRIAREDVFVYPEMLEVLAQVEALLQAGRS